ncbi:MAG: NifB/NifX family molybdenum-iron cluster-binding protein [Candidatus Electryonea clarkiae]|nr:NifB/NifX family molybdenum-iron cluster-binding protein [Candidatus Electryonea clarkiae]
MKYLIAASAADSDAKIAKRFGHAEYYLTVDSEIMEFTVSPGFGEDQPFHGANRFTGSGIQRVIVGNVGPSAFRDLINAGLSVYSCHGITVLEAVKKVHSGLVAPLEAPTMRRSVHEGGHGQGRTGRGGGKNRRDH